ncbi:hypothetical protein D3874_05950 [Oleomonas cavernae]|uniref:Uncharacterized protein n=1 Tax=Oleomonas cavernae TaxID=2320859 RepID=A0A418W9E6_9PROT|nr:hypothetical protein [Oleomonas cavernae]RJF86618.1 hypothetical protein D3874_05950 [Oleomonas cavernae]
MGWRSFALVAIIVAMSGQALADVALPPREIIEQVRLEDPTLINRFLDAAVDPDSVPRVAGISLGVARTIHSLKSPSVCFSATDNAYLAELTPIVAEISTLTDEPTILRPCGQADDPPYLLLIMDYDQRREKVASLMNSSSFVRFAVKDFIKVTVGVDGIERQCGEVHFMTNGMHPSRITLAFAVIAAEAPSLARKRCFALMLLRFQGLSMGAAFDNGSPPPEADLATAMTPEERLFLWMLYRMTPGLSRAAAKAQATVLIEQIQQQP